MSKNRKSKMWLLEFCNKKEDSVHKVSENIDLLKQQVEKEWRCKAELIGGPEGYSILITNDEEIGSIVPVEKI